MSRRAVLSPKCERGRFGAHETQIGLQRLEPLLTTFAVIPQETVNGGERVLLVDFLGLLVLFERYAVSAPRFKSVSYGDSRSNPLCQN